jgi:hypothetical protein
MSGDRPGTKTVRVSKFLGELAALRRRTPVTLIAVASELQHAGLRIWTLVRAFIQSGRSSAGFALETATALFWFRVVIPWALDW